MTTPIVLDPSQQQAVELACSGRVVVITGGPGTGKTTVCKTVLDRWHAAGLSSADVALCSPTGKAARRLSESTGRDAKTIHRLLAWSNGAFTYGADLPLPHSAIIIDEASMVDVQLAACLLDAVRDGTRVVFVGDVDQLPSVGPGTVLADLIAAGVPTARLQHIHRQSAHSHISNNAALVRAGKMPVVDDPESTDFFWRREDDASLAAAEIVRLAVDQRRHGIECQALCPQRKGACGVDALNTALQRAINPPRDGVTEWLISDAVLRDGDRVMHIKNDYTLGVMNGETGAIIGFEDGAMAVDFGDRTVWYGKREAAQLRLCYAATIHKSQGSEYPCVVVAVHSSHSFMLNRSLLYTAITRGKQEVWLVGDEKGLRRAVKNADATQRYSGLAEAIRGEVQP